ncbi:MAG TPA: hypothetical protein DDZ51_09315 [Planctomycetaceae bacterium]|nr:hypothetical protein [Planctomycetaceae bacterium]
MRHGAIAADQNCSDKRECRLVSGLRPFDCGWEVVNEWLYQRGMRIMTDSLLGVAPTKNRDSNAGRMFCEYEPVRWPRVEWNADLSG